MAMLTATVMGEMYCSTARSRPDSANAMMMNALPMMPPCTSRIVACARAAMRSVAGVRLAWQGGGHSLQHGVQAPSLAKGTEPNAAAEQDIAVPYKRARMKGLKGGAHARKRSWLVPSGASAQGCRAFTSAVMAAVGTR